MARGRFSWTWPTWEAWLTCLALGGALAGAVALFGGVRATFPVVAVVVLVCLACAPLPLLRRGLLALGALAAALLLVTLFTPILRPALTALTELGAPAPADAIVVLGGGVSCGSAQLEATSAARLTRGLELWRAGYAPLLTVSEQSNLFGGASCPKIAGLEQAEVKRLYGGTGPHLEVLRNVTDTADEARRAGGLARQLGWRRVLLVTSPSHSRRAAKLFRAQGLTVISVPADEPRFDLTLPQPADRLEALRVVLYEVLSRLRARLRSD